MLWIALLLVMTVIVAVVAGVKGRNIAGWTLYGLLLPPVALVHVLVTGRSEAAEERRAAAAGRVACPHCAEMIKPQAKVCPFCRRDVPQTAQAVAKSTPPVSAGGRASHRHI